MKILDKVGIVFNVALGIFYIPFSFFCYLLSMGYENVTITNEVLAFIFQLLSFLMFMICGGSILASVILRHRGKSVSSFWVQFVPFGVLMLQVVLYVLSLSYGKIFLKKFFLNLMQPFGVVNSIICGRQRESLHT